MSKAKNLGAGASFAQARPISARRAAIGAATEAPTVGVPDPAELPLHLISQNPDNPREELRDLDGLADSIREIGLVNAITVATIEAYLAARPERTERIDDGTRYIVVDGHRRLEASRRAGAQVIRVSVNNDLVATDEALLEAAFVANVHRDDMNPIEQAHALEKLVKFYGSQNKAAKRLGIGQSTISSKLSILDLTPTLQADLVEGRRKVEHVRNLSKLTPEQQLAKADERAQVSERGAAAQRGVSRRDSSAAKTSAPAMAPQPSAATPDLSRRDRSQPPANEQDTALAPQQEADVPEPRSAPLEARPDQVHPGSQDVWSDGQAAMDQALAGLSTFERSRFLHRYVERAGSTDALVQDLARGIAKPARHQLAAILEAAAQGLRQAR
ncbi:ParB/RepB/Spo0J family partition protein [Streptomyces sp. NPDC007355]|uniref:ParB/RepB/Spo0J family partition protein n=1 Tax=Streptomyces sp. NPDC007355 TaxID=3364778 RepID=UPI0036C65C57